MATQRLMSRINISEKAKTELIFVGQCIAAAGLLATVVALVVAQ